jgi:hypothetical protein
MGSFLVLAYSSRSSSVSGNAEKVIGMGLDNEVAVPAVIGRSEEGSQRTTPGLKTPLGWRTFGIPSQLKEQNICHSGSRSILLAGSPDPDTTCLFSLHCLLTV